MKKLITSIAFALVLAVVGVGQICPPQIVFLRDISVTVEAFESQGCTDLRVKRLMERRGLWEIRQNGGNEMPSDVILSGAGSAVNGTYTYRGTANGKPYYNLVGEPDDTAFDCVLFTASVQWAVKDGAGDTPYLSDSTTDFPWQATWFTEEGIPPAPTFTELAGAALPVFRHHYQNQGIQ